eukprot:TRINITY_DN18734_c0_g1_i1.p1 TRINITY_DN18734_c0_g1~~TRINITY_DN18734_c0_g1_i1.p1  ORF type:complete len:529 (+),score=129.78 TRINITY_DN18734_c0_g1_i1:144-1730(+)
MTINVQIKVSNGSKFTAEGVDVSWTVRDFKESLVEKSEIVAEQQRLIYKGRVLKDESTLESYGLENDHTLHLVRGAAPIGTSTAGTTAAPAGAMDASRSASRPQAGAAAGPGLGFGGLGGLPDLQQMQEQMLQNPNMMRDMLGSPAMQSLMSSPELIRSVLMSNPQMREVLDQNPELNHILSDPAILRRTMDAARNPDLMREMMRNTDRAMSNIEAMPEGFNMLRRMYETVQEPLMNAATRGGENGGDGAANPFAAMFGTPAGGLPGDQAARTAGTPGAATAAGPAPNTAPLPNPWTPPATGGVPAAGATRTGTTPGGEGAATVGLGGAFDPFGLGAFGGEGMGGLGGLPSVDPATMQQMLQNPLMQQMMQTVLSSPQVLNQIIDGNPQLRAMFQSNPQLREMMGNPELLRQLTNPQGLQQMLMLNELLRGSAGGFGGIPSATGAAAPTAGAAQQPELAAAFNNLFGPMGAFGAVPPVNNTPPEELYATQLQQLRDMGFFDPQENIRALQATNGNVHAAVERLLQGPG